MSALPDKTWLFVSDIAPYFDVSEDTVSKSMDLPFTRISKKLKAVHIEDLKLWELKKRAITGESLKRATANDYPPRQLPERKARKSNRSLSNVTNADELAGLLSTRSGRQ